ncbi:dirigent protein 10-like [Macadamia integrifolia]|uniref:dirigent protein 10-like n=1 Tax=Macadamia integrifolia TaxID=60698 RepID=UPI001C4F4F8A|nr:dirigent protein 10-like [Macadamia integrifolia]
MEFHKSISTSHRAIAHLFLLALALTCTTTATGARIPDQVLPPTSAVIPTPVASAFSPVQPSVTQVAPLAAVPAATVSVIPPNAAAAPGAPASATVAGSGPNQPMSFFMHDIVGGTNPSARAVTGIVTNPAVNGDLPFARPNGAVLPVNNGVPQNNGNNGIVNNNNIPFLTGLGGNTAQVFQNNGGNNVINGGGSKFPVANGGKLPTGNALQDLTFGTMTVIDDEVTDGEQLGSGSLGKAQGFYVVSSEDGTSQTMAFTVMFESGGYADSLSFFGVHRTAVTESQLAIMGGTGKYVKAKGYAAVKTLPSVDQNSTDGVETLLQLTVYVTY